MVYSYLLKFNSNIKSIDNMQQIKSAVLFMNIVLTNSNHLILVYLISYIAVFLLTLWHMQPSCFRFGGVTGLWQNSHKTKLIRTHIFVTPFGSDGNTKMAIEYMAIYS